MISHRILVIGVGSIGERHVRCFGRTDRCDVSICEINEPLRQTIAERYAIGSAFGNLADALNDPPDAAVICAPAHLHIPMATQLAEAGVHLLIEKPLSVGFEGIERLFALVQEQNLTAAVAYVSRMNPALAAMREAIQSGRFGEPLQIVGLSGQNFPLYRPAYREIYYNNRATGGGAVQDALTHLMNSGQWLVGPMTELAADAAHLALEGVDVEDTVHVIARHGAVMGSYALNQHQAPNETSITVVCTSGTARCEFHRSRWVSAANGTTVSSRRRTGFWMPSREMPNRLAHSPKVGIRYRPTWPFCRRRTRTPGRRFRRHSTTKWRLKRKRRMIPRRCQKAPSLALQAFIYDETINRHGDKTRFATWNNRRFNNSST